MIELIKNIPGYDLFKKLAPDWISFNRKYLYFQEFHNSLCEHLISDPIIKINEFNGKFTIDMRSDLFKRILYFGEYEKVLTSRCLEYVDTRGDCVDIGANVGFFTVLFARACPEGKVLSVEPSSSALARLYRNIEINKLNNVLVFEGVALDCSGSVDLETVEGKDEYSSVGNSLHPSAFGLKKSKSKVKSSTLDELVNNYNVRPRLIKIDVEGVENLVLSGGLNVIKEFSPVLVLEVVDALLRSNGSSSKDMINFIKNQGYMVHDINELKKEIDDLNNGNIFCFPFQ